MSIADELKQVAAEIARSLGARKAGLQTELAELEARESEIEALLKAETVSPVRLSNFEPQVGGDFQCPRCWIEHEKRSVLATEFRETRHEDLFRCQTCGYELEISF